MAVQLVGWFGWLNDCVVGCLVWVVEWLCSWLVGWFGWLNDCVVGCLVWVVEWLCSWLVGLGG